MGLFGKSWIQIVANPIGYIANRKSPEKAAQEYLEQNPTSNLITEGDTELSFKEDGRSWVDSCAAKLKSDDVGKTVANCQKACQAAFDNDGNVIYVKDYILQQAVAEKQMIQTKLEEGLKSVFILIGAFLFLGLLYYLLTSKD